MVCHVVELNELKSHVQTCYRTMKLEGCLQEVPILLLIDSGANHNYITRELVMLLNLPIFKTKQYVKNTLQLDAYILELGGIDVILEVEWLETLGEVKSN